MNAETLAESLRAAVEALGNGRPADAAALLEPVARHDALSRASDLQDVRARVCSLLAQAHLESGQPKRAAQWCATSLRILRQHPDLEGQDQVRALQAAIEAAIEAQGLVLDPERALPQARRALEDARENRSIRGQVLALLSLARLDSGGAAAYVHEALTLADDNSAQELVAAVARAATELNIELPGPQR